MFNTVDTFVYSANVGTVHVIHPSITQGCNEEYVSCCGLKGTEFAIICKNSR